MYTKTVLVSFNHPDKFVAIPPDQCPSCADVQLSPRKTVCTADVLLVPGCPSEGKDVTRRTLEEVHSVGWEKVPMMKGAETEG